MHRRLRICGAKGGAGCFRPRIPAAKVDLHREKNNCKCGATKNKHGYNQNIASKSNRRWLKNYEKLVVRIGTDILKIMAVVVLCDTSYFCIAFGRTHPTSGTKCFQIIYNFFLNPECERILWLLAPEKFPIENFRVRSNLGKISTFH